MKVVIGVIAGGADGNCHYCHCCYFIVVVDGGLVVAVGYDHSPCHCYWLFVDIIVNVSGCNRHH